MSARFLVFTVVLALLGAYTGLHAAELFTRRPLACLGGGVLFSLGLLCWQVLNRAKRFPGDVAWARAAGWTVSVAMGAWSAFLFFCAAGDLIDGTVERLAAHVAPLAGLSAPLGVYYVTGNHEYYWGAPAWIEQVRRLGWTALINENRIVERDRAKILVGGVPDETAPAFVPDQAQDFAKAAEGTADLKILLAHRPTSYARAERAGFRLQLSGHTHGGQFFPWNLLIPLFHRYYRGLRRHGRMRLYVSSGTGYWGPALRFGVPAEIALLTLRRAAIDGTGARKPAQLG